MTVNQIYILFIWNCVGVNMSLSSCQTNKNISTRNLSLVYIDVGLWFDNFRIPWESYRIVYIIVISEFDLCAFDVSKNMIHFLVFENHCYHVFRCYLVVLRTHQFLSYHRITFDIHCATLSNVAVICWYRT